MGKNQDANMNCKLEKTFSRSSTQLIKFQDRNQGATCVIKV